MSNVGKGMFARLLLVRLLFLLVGFFVILPTWAAEGDAVGVSQDDAGNEALDYIAIIDGEKIAIAEYISALRRGMKERFYHGTIPEEERKKYYKEVADELIERFLLVREARNRKIQPDMEAVNETIKRYDDRFKDDADWAAAREEILSRIRKKLEDDSLLIRLEEQVKDIANPTDAQLEEFYTANEELFTTPERVRVSVILLRVDPSSGGDVWKQARVEAAAIVDRLNAGADFEELARIHSSDDSAQNGGDMGYVHTGMLGVNAQKVLDIMEPGETSAPVVMLDGVAVFRLDERVVAKLNPLEAVKERAKKLYMRDKGEEAWANLLTKLRSESKVIVNDAPWQ